MRQVVDALHLRQYSQAPPVACTPSASRAAAASRAASQIASARGTRLGSRPRRVAERVRRRSLAPGSSVREAPADAVGRRVRRCVDDGAGLEDEPRAVVGALQVHRLLVDRQQAMTLDQSHAEVREPPSASIPTVAGPSALRAPEPSATSVTSRTGDCQHLRNARPLAMTLDVEHDDRPVRECGAGQHLGRGRGAEECGRRRSGRDHDKSRASGGHIRRRRPRRRTRPLHRVAGAPCLRQSTSSANCRPAKSGGPRSGAPGLRPPCRARARSRDARARRPPARPRDRRARPDDEHVCALPPDRRSPSARSLPAAGFGRTRSETCVSAARCTGCTRCTLGCVLSRRAARAPARAGRRSARASSPPGRRRRRRAHLGDLGPVDPPFGDHGRPGVAGLARAANGTPCPGSSSIGGTIRNGSS